MNESEFQNQLIELAHRFGWKAFHARPARFADGRVATHFSGDAGFPDLVLAHPTRGVIFAELKSKDGRTTREQVEWLETLGKHVEAHLWRPADLHNIIRRLQR